MRTDSQKTVDELLNVAERLFARHGVEHVALTRIVASSRQKNRSALHYHFGSREGLLAAVLGRRLNHINTLRHAMLEEVVGSSGLAETVRALVAPLGSVVLTESWGPDYVSILAQVRFHPGLLGKRVLGDASLSSIRQCRRLIEQALPESPRTVLLRRLGWFTDSIVLAIARWAHETPKPSQTHSGMQDLVDSLVAYGVAGFSAWQPELSRAGGTVRRVV